MDQWSSSDLLRCSEISSILSKELRMRPWLLIFFHFYRENSPPMFEKVPRGRLAFHSERLVMHMNMNMKQSLINNEKRLIDKKFIIDLFYVYKFLS